MPELSVCITHYNRPAQLGVTLQSLAEQTRPPDEVLIWDDHSPNDPTPVVEQFRSRFRRLRFHRNPGNLGMPGNLNAVIREAQGDLIANLHDADVYQPTLLERWECALMSCPSAGIVFCGLEATAHSGRAGRVWVHEFAGVTSGKDFFERAYVGQSSSPIWGTVMARRETYQRHLPFDSRFGGWADVDMWMRVCGTHDIAYVPMPLITLYAGSHFRREFRWETIHLILTMHVLNINRMAQSDSELQVWLARQRSHSTKVLARLLFGRVAKLEFRSCAQALLMYKEWLAVLSGRPSL
jgi:GT2 family glycosyltransferase